MIYEYKYPRPAVTADCVVITQEAEPRVLLVKRGNEPYKGSWAFPGGFMNIDETTEQCAIRELEEETGVRITGINQIGAFSKVDRDPRGRTITVAYLAIVDKPLDARGMDDAAGAAWFPINKLPKLAFDHQDIMAAAKKLYDSIPHQQAKIIPGAFEVRRMYLRPFLELNSYFPKSVITRIVNIAKTAPNYDDRKEPTVGTICSMPVLDILKSRKLGIRNVAKLRGILQVHGLDLDDFQTELELF